MARLGVLIVCCQLFALPLLGGKCDDENPLADLAGAFLQNMGDGNGGGGLAALGNIVGSLMQDKSRSNGGDVLSGLGSLLTNQDGSIDPTIIGSVISMIAQQLPLDPLDPDQQDRPKRDTTGQGIDIASLIGAATSSLINSKSTEKYLPLIINAISSLSSDQAEKLAHDHKDHADFLPPILERIHLYWDIFANSEIGKTIWYKSGLERAMKAFEGPDGKVSFELMLKNFENHSFRRHWIKTAANYLTDTVMHMAKPEVYQRYIISAQYLINGYIDAQGLPKSAQFDSNRPEKSIAALFNHLLKKYFDMDTDVTVYVKPALDYVKNILILAKTASQKLKSKEDRQAIADGLTDALNLEMIEPVLRVHRAYRHSLAAPQCQEHLMCLVNRHHDADKEGMPGFKPALTKLSSLVASAALSYQNGKGFWDLYNAIQDDVNCEAKYPADCAAFHEHELKVTTEVYHSEL